MYGEIVKVSGDTPAGFEPGNPVCWPEGLFNQSSQPSFAINHGRVVPGVLFRKTSTPRLDSSWRRRVRRSRRRSRRKRAKKKDGNAEE